MSNFSIDPDEQVLFIFFEENAQPTKQNQNAINECKEKHHLEGGWAQDSNLFILTGHGSALIYAERELNTAGLSAHISTYNELHQDAPKDTYGEAFNEDTDDHDPIAFDPINDRILAIYPFSSNELLQAQNSKDTVSIIQTHLNNAAKNHSVNSSFEGIIGDLHDHCDFGLVPDQSMGAVLIAGSLDDMIFAREYFTKLNYAAVIMTQAQYAQGLNAFEVKESSSVAPPRYN